MFGMLSCINLGGHNTKTKHNKYKNNKYKYKNTKTTNTTNTANTMHNCSEAGGHYQHGINPSVPLLTQLTSRPARRDKNTDQC